jgi:hypothetical protein
MIGFKTGDLTAIRQTESKNGSRQWVCICTCGNETIKTTGGLRSGVIKSCGCKNRKHITVDMDRKLSRHPLYARYSNIISRCTNPKGKNWHRYGGRGITVCKRWLESFEHFLQDVGLPSFPGAQIDRVDNDGNYEPGNIRWATSKENCNNRTKKPKS